MLGNKHPKKLDECQKSDNGDCKIKHHYKHQHLKTTYHNVSALMDEFMFHIYSPVLSVHVVSENVGFKPQVLTQSTGKVKRATPEGAAKNIEPIGRKDIQ